MKICAKCKIEKPLDSFYPCKRKKSGRASRCKSCHAISRMENREKNNKRTNDWYYKNRDKALLYSKIQREKNKEKTRLYNKQYRKDNLEKVREWYKNRMRNKRATDPQFVLICRTRDRIRDAIIGGYKSTSSQELVGCSMKEYKIYLESLFVDGMTWDAFLKGEIHIDHKIPCCAFDLTDSAQQRECFHYTNTQPLWAGDNTRKLAEDLKIRDKRRLDKLGDSGVSHSTPPP